MSKHGTFADYPPRSLAAAEAALLTVWPTLSRYHDDLVLVGGLAVHCLTRRGAGGWPGAVTMDVDFGIALAAEGGQYGTVKSDLNGLGFKPAVEQPDRLVRDVEGIPLYVDFLTEASHATGGSRIVDDVLASVVPGINRALESRRGDPERARHNGRSFRRRFGGVERAEHQGGEESEGVFHGENGNEVSVGMKCRTVWDDLPRTNGVTSRGSTRARRPPAAGSGDFPGRRA